MAGYIGANTSSVTNNQNAAERRKKFTFTANTTVLSGLSFLPDKIHIFHNGIRLVKNTDFTEAADGQSVTLINAAQAGDEIVAVTFDQNPAIGGGSSYTDADVDAHLLTAGVTLDATNDRVGINESTPTGSLHVKGTSTAHGKIILEAGGSGGSANNNYMEFNKHDGTKLGEIEIGESVSNGGSILLKTTPSGGSATTRMTINHDGEILTPNKPVFGANRNGLSGVNNVAQIIDWNVLVNQGNHFSTSTNRFTCPVAGKYYCSFYSLTHTGNTSAASLVHIRKNGTNTYQAYSDTVSSINYLSYSVAGLFDCAANDILDFYNGSGYVYGGNYSGAAIYLIG